MNPQTDENVLLLQEKALHFGTFNADTAWRLGQRLRALALERSPEGVGCTIEIELNHQLLFACTTPGATAGQADWIRRKRNVVRRFGRSTYAVGRQLALENETLPSRHFLDERDHAAHGGGFPVILEGTGMVGTIVFSGLPQRDDHNLVVDALADLLGVDPPRLP